MRASLPQQSRRLAGSGFGGPDGSKIVAVLGPTNTGKTHLAVERLCAHASGMIGFPLRLLAREVYDRVVAIKGAGEVALITGEEKIVPPGARWFLCTMESMPLDREVAFVGIDEAQLGADPERGHVFTQRLLHCRGYAETMILGAETLRPLIRKLLPEAEIITRPRFSTLSYAGAKKLSRLPRRSAIVAFTATEVYALAEMLRRQKGGAAVVMGSLSPRTRNAQVAMYQSGEVDYLVATDAIGMGLNMDIAHVAFASLSKFDGKRHRRLRLAEMAQIAGRAGRYQKDGTFGTVQLGTQAAASFSPEEIEGLEAHHFEPLSQLVWRNAALDHTNLQRFIASLDARSPHPELQRGEDAIDLAVLKSLAVEPWVMERLGGKLSGPRGVARLWAACGLPDYRKTGPEQHGALVARVFRHLSEGDGHLPDAWIASELAHLDRVSGDVETIANRIASARTWTYVAHRPDWLANPLHWAERARAVEERLSDALHLALTQRFVDRRTAVLLKDLKVRGGEQRVEIDSDGAVAVEGEVIGRIDGFHFSPDPLARAGEQRMLLAAAERYLVHVLSKRARALGEAGDSAFVLQFAGEMPPRLLWDGARVATLRKGRDALSPRLQLDRALGALAPADRAVVQERLEGWLATATAQALGPLVRLSERASGMSPAARGLVVRLVETLGVLPRDAAEDQLAALGRADRQGLAAAGARLGVTHVFVPALLRPEPTRWRLALWAVWTEQKALPLLPPPGRVSLSVEDGWPAGFLETAGFWRIGAQAVRIDIVDRLARAIHGRREGRVPFVPDPHWAASAGLSHDGLARLLRALGYKPQLVDGTQHFAWKGQARGQRRPEASVTAENDGARDAGVRAPSPFSILADVRFADVRQQPARQRSR
ncbi:ATP-dependent RNA helicase SUPV3L1/SUV3 [Polymorphobacter multimanifer]|uniref:ATP-dependent RNA helicase SUPV3L1/SUV3 n=1 Tax=Polymorphobacter multimanifer TaxID=1070431 RepID=A0A841LF89_9SPHN|nr:helicase-related protein [Polymorphobacter multimanifer]MBB6227638.1 ATP-dependent RNA helicase SUPV3L1/SUV3 [Polymorphobacter multimanifer]